MADRNPWLGLTALLASFMSGMAGNLATTKPYRLTYDIYQAYINKRATDAHYSLDGAIWPQLEALCFRSRPHNAATSFINIMDALQLVFSFVNAPLFATFLLGNVLEAHYRPCRFCRAAFGNRRCSDPSRINSSRGCDGRNSWRVDHPLHHYPSDMAQNFLDCHLRFLRQPCRHDRSEPYYTPASGS